MLVTHIKIGSEWKNAVSGFRYRVVGYAVNCDKHTVTNLPIEVTTVAYATAECTRLLEDSTISLKMGSPILHRTVTEFMQDFLLC